MVLVNGLEAAKVVAPVKSYVQRYKAEICTACIGCDAACAKDLATRIAGYEDGFNAGLEVGKLKWHKVADGDLPPSLTHVLNEKGNKVMYDVRERTWQEYSDYYEDYVEAEQPVAWCEVPKFEEE